jgi:hypothetical protein
MSDLCRLIWRVLIGLFRSRAALEAENLVLRHQLNVLQRGSRIERGLAVRFAPLPVCAENLVRFDSMTEIA